MRKPVFFLLVFSLVGCFPVLADTLGFRVGLSVDSPDAPVEEKDLFLTPKLEFERPLGNFDLYAGTEYSFHLTTFFPQFFFAKEAIAAHLPFGSLWEILLTLENENTLLVDPDRDSEWIGGRVSPGAGAGLFLPAGDFSLALDFPIDYCAALPRLMPGQEKALFGLDLTAAYISPFWIGIRAAANFILNPDTALDGAEFALTYGEDQFYGELAFKAAESLGYFSIRAQFDYFFDFFILSAGVEAGNLGNRDEITLAPALGIKYRF
ncbi:MAG: hypothetical protein LBF74_08750 [Treponema sp.]|jgi:hypothetical protein|nr:hypothetical protein [Treponema sp.]